MTLNQFIAINNIRQADAIMVKRKNVGMLNHYVIFLGYDRSNNPLFVANYTKGVNIITDNELRIFLTEMEPKKIVRFNGSEHQRQQAVNRAISKIGEKSYDLIFNNCEHYATYVQTGYPYSEQSENFGKAFFVGSLALAVGLLISSFSSKE